jgi:hypothetical protein
MADAYREVTMEQKDMKFIVFWISRNTNKSRGWTTAEVAARFKEFDEQVKAQQFYDKMVTLATAGQDYQSRQPSHVTRSWQ